MRTLLSWFCSRALARASMSAAALSLSVACVDLASRDEPQRPNGQLDNAQNAHVPLIGQTHSETIAARGPFPTALLTPESTASPDASTPPGVVGAALPPLEPASTRDAGAPIATAPVARGDGEAFPDWQAEPYAQRQGDPERGRRLMIDNGTLDTPYMSCGLPEAAVRLAGLDRDWPSSLKVADRRDPELPYDSSYVTRPSGVRLVSSNCFFCHASKLGQQLVLGLGEVNRDFTQQDTLSGSLGTVLRLVSRALLDRPAQDELTRMLRVAEATARFPTLDTIGINPADSMFGMLVRHRDPVTLAWLTTPDPLAGPPPGRLVFTDVPALWITHRRPHLFHAGFAHGDLARVMMTAALLCLEDRDEARRIDAFFPDIQAYINALRPPKFEAFAGRAIDADLAARGAAHFTRLCRGCHGGKDGEGPPPRTFVSLREVGTDPDYAEMTVADSPLPEAQMISYFFEFFNRSWYGQEGHAGKLVRPSVLGYVPPPLDGVWATAPYFHNASVPTLAGVLDPAQRPRIFKRSLKPEEYDFERGGYPYEERSEKAGDPSIYDTTQFGMSNQGHTFAAALSAAERAELLEYLKTF